MSAGPSEPAASLEARTDGPDDTRALAAALAPALVRGDMVLLVGDLGAGKTTFAQGLAAGLGVAEQVTSPTFTLVRPYACAPAPGGNGHEPVRTMLHADLYRTERLREVGDLALGELVEDEAVAVVEWGDMGAPVLGAGAIVVRITGPDESGPDDARVVALELPPGLAGRVEDLRRRLGRWLSERG